jgi:hypothetical protein
MSMTTRGAPVAQGQAIASYTPQPPGPRGSLARTARVALLERRRRQELLTPATISMMALTASGYLPATVPTLVWPMIWGLTAVMLVFGLALLLHRAHRGQTAIACYILGLLMFYALAVFITPTGPNGQLAITNFTAGNLYYFLADVLPILASALLLDMPWPVLVNGIVCAINMVAIWVLPHDATFEQFVSNLGGPLIGGRLFLASSITIGQVVLIVFALASARTIRSALASSMRASDLEEVNRVLDERQRALEGDIQSLQQTHAQLANGQFIHATLAPKSEIYPVAVSLNLLIDRVARLSRADFELRQIERGLAVASDVVTRLSQGDLTTQPPPTGTPVDGLVLALTQVQRQIAGWIGEVGGVLREAEAGHRQALGAAQQLAQALRQLEALGGQDGMALATSEAEAILGARRAAESLIQQLQTVDAQERRIVAAVGRMRIGP